MELYLDVKPIGRGSKGRTACGSAAYRSCNEVIDNDGRRHNYKNKTGWIAGGIELPAGAPEELRSRQILWSRHDAKESRKDAQIFREIVVALPNELPDATCAGIVKDLIAPLVEMGMCAQWDIHNVHPKNENEGGNKHPENKHAHVMLTMRELLPDGTFGNKKREWNKYNGGLNIAEMLRPEAARLMNEQLTLMGSKKRVEHESYAKRGIDKLPQIHVGVAGTAISERGETSYRKAMNEVIKKLNAENISYKERLERLHEARTTLANVGIKETTKPSLFSQIQANELIKNTPNITGADSRIRANYNNIREFNQQIYDLRKEKKQTEKYRKALFLVKNLAGDTELDAEQKALLQWAQGYLKWALQREDVPEGEDLKRLIEEAKERNTERCLGIYAAETGKRDALTAIAEERAEAYRRKKGITVIDAEEL